MKATNQTVQRSFNRSLVLHQVRQSGRTSRVDLSRSLGLEKSSITAIVGELVENGLLREAAAGEGPVSVGRRPVALELNSEYCCFLGIEVQPTRYQSVLLDLGGRVLHQEAGPIAPGIRSFEGKLDHIYEKLGPVIAAQKPPLAGVGIGLPGLINPLAGSVELSVPHSLKNWALPRHPNPWGVPASIENDANCCAWATLLDGDPTNGGDFLVVFMEFQEPNPETGQAAGVSVGFGVVMGGEVHYGRNFEAGEYRSLQWKEGHKSQAGLDDGELEQITRDPKVLDRYLTELMLNLVPIGTVMAPERIVFCQEAGRNFYRIPGILAGPLAGTWWTSSGMADRLTRSRFGPEEVAYGAAARLLMTLFSFNRRTASQREPGTLTGWNWDYLFSRFGPAPV